MQHFKTLAFLFSANTISGFAQGITMIAIPWYLIQQPGGKALNALLVAFVTLASLFWGVYAGTLIDRYNRKHILLTYNGLDALILGLVAGAGFWLGELPFFLVALIYTTTVFTYNVHYPNLYAFVQELFEPRFYAKVNSAIEIQGQTTSFIGMMVGGILLDGSPELAWWPGWLRFDAWQLHEIFLLDGATYLLGFLLLSQIPYRPALSKEVDRGPVMQRMRQGFQYLRDHRPILRFGIASHMVFFALLVTIQVIMPVYVKDYLAAPALVLSSFKGFYSIGAISAGLLGLSALIKRGHLVRQVIFLLGLAGVLFLTLALTRSVTLTLILAVFIGICNAGTRILRVTYLVRVVPNRVIGRVNSFLMVINVMLRTAFIGLLAVPFFASEKNGDHMVYAFALLGIILFLSAGILMAHLPTFERKAAVSE